MADLLTDLGAALAHHYRLGQELGRGGMATVYLAQDLRHDRPVALKVLHPHLAQVLGGDRFLREVHIAARLQHPHILALFDSGDTGGMLWYTMPFVPGQTLRDRLREEGRLSVDEAVRLAREVALALDHAHRHGVVHRDIKPENILLSEGSAVVADFGVARALDNAAGNEALTQTGFAIGTPAYMSPEQSAGDTADARSDIYSLGCVLYEMLAGEVPLAAPTPQAALVRRFTETPDPVRAARSDVPEAVDRAVARALERDPAQRFASAAEFATALTDVRPTPSALVPAPAANGGSSIAVLPFVNMSADPEAEYFADGMAEELLNALTRVHALRVAARTSSFAFKGRNVQIGEIGRQLNVETILEGSVRRAGNRLRITAQLIDVEAGFHLWSARYDRELADVFEIQDEIAGSIVSALRLVLTERERQALGAGRATDVRAYEYYLRGRQLAHQHRRQGNEAALRMFREAIAIDPGYARAYAGMADCHSWLYMYLEATDENLRKADEASRRALELDPDSGEAHAARGLAISLDKRYDEAIAELDRAVALAPTLFEAHYLHGRVCWAAGRLDEAARHFENAGTARPEDFQAPSFLATVYDSLGRTEEAFAAHAISIERARRHLELYPSDTRALYLGAISLRRNGQEAEAGQWAARVRETASDDPAVWYNLACFYSLGGDVDEAFRCLERAITLGYAHRAWIENDGDLVAVRADSRYPALLERFQRR